MTFEELHEEFRKLMSDILEAEDNLYQRELKLEIAASNKLYSIYIGACDQFLESGDKFGGDSEMRKMRLECYYTLEELKDLSACLAKYETAFKPIADQSTLLYKEIGKLIK